jgi:hypothetical protein
MKAGQSDYTACIVTVTMLYSNSQPELPKNWGQIIWISMITTATLWRFTVHFAYWISLTGGINEKTCTPILPTSLVWHTIYSLAHHMVSEWRPDFPLGEALSAVGSQKPQARPFAKQL